MKYEVIFRPFTERHFIRAFSKKYKNAWERTLKGLILEFSYPDRLFEKTVAEAICVSDDADIKICKTEFRIAGPGKSRHASGNRCIIAVHKSTAVVQVLLVYSKGNIGGPNETARWKSIIKDAYPEYRNLL